MTGSSFSPSAEGPQASLRTMISRLTAFIDDETSQIEHSTDFDFRASSERKSRMLFELNRTSRAMDLAQLEEPILSELARLKSALALNEARILAHLTAVREVSEIMVNILKNEDADGTYGELV